MNLKEKGKRLSKLKQFESYKYHTKDFINSSSELMDIISSNDAHATKISNFLKEIDRLTDKLEKISGTLQE